MPSQIALFHGTQSLVLQLLMFSVFTGLIWNAMHFLHLVGWLKFWRKYAQWQGPSAFYCFSVDNTELVSAAFATFDRSLNPFASKGQPSYIAWVSRALSLETQLTPIRIEVITCWQGLFWWSKQGHKCLMALWDWSTVQFSFEEMVLLVWAKERVDFLQAHVNEVVNFTELFWK